MSCFPAFLILTLLHGYATCAEEPNKEQAFSENEDVLNILALQREPRSAPDQKTLTIHAPERTPEKMVQVMPSSHEAPAENEPDKDPTAPIYLGKFLNPWEFGNQKELIEFDFENADLRLVIEYMERRLGLTFILDDQIQPLSKEGKSIVGAKVSFRTHRPLTKKEAWNVFVTFLDMAGITPQPGPNPRMYRLVSTAYEKDKGGALSHGPLPTFIGVDPSLVPDNDTRVRYVYFVQNSDFSVIQNVIAKLRSSSSPDPIALQEMRAIIMTDRGANIRSMLTIINELDKVNAPESLAVVKLKRTKAKDVVALYKALQGKKEDQQTLAARLFGARKSSTKALFADSVVMIAEERTNTLVLLGPITDIKTVETFIELTDREFTAPFAPIHVYTLRHVEAEPVAKILNEVINQNQSHDMPFGGVRDGDQFFGKGISINAEKSGNRLVINASYEDYIKLYEVLQHIDVEQPQVALKVLIMNVDIDQNKEFGVQLRDKKPGLDGWYGNNVNWQTSGLAGQAAIVEDPTGSGATRLLGDLIKLASPSTTAVPNLVRSAGSTLMTLGSDAYGVWGMLRVLDTYARINVIANPFLVTTNKYPAKVKVGDIRRIQSSTVFSAQTAQTQRDQEAVIEVNITPQVSTEGFVHMEITVEIQQFTEASPNNGNRRVKLVKTAVLAANQDVVALGGLTRDRSVEIQTKVPILGDIPFFGWLFKNKEKEIIQEHLVVLVCPEIIPAHTNAVAQKFTGQCLNDSRKLLVESHENQTERHDPIHRWFFKDNDDVEEKLVNDFVESQSKYIDPDVTKRIQKQHQQQAAVKAGTNKAAVPAGALELGDGSLAAQPKRSSIGDFFEPAAERALTT